MLRSTRTGAPIPPGIVSNLADLGLLYRVTIPSHYYSYEPSDNIDEGRCALQEPFYCHLVSKPAWEIPTVIFADWRYNFLPSVWQISYTKQLKEHLYEHTSGYWNGSQLVFTQNSEHLTCSLPASVNVLKAQLKQEMKQIKKPSIIFDYKLANKNLACHSLIDFKSRESAYQPNVVHFWNKIENTFFLRDMLIVPESEWNNILALVAEDAAYFHTLDITLFECDFTGKITEERKKKIITDIFKVLNKIDTIVIKNYDDILLYLPFVPMERWKSIKHIVLTSPPNNLSDVKRISELKSSPHDWKNLFGLEISIIKFFDGEGFHEPVPGGGYIFKKIDESVYSKLAQLIQERFPSSHIRQCNRTDDGYHYEDSSFSPLVQPSLPPMSSSYTYLVGVTVVCKAGKKGKLLPISRWNDFAEQSKGCYSMKVNSNFFIEEGELQKNNDITGLQLYEFKIKEDRVVPFFNALPALRRLDFDSCSNYSFLNKVPAAVFCKLQSLCLGSSERENAPDKIHFKLLCKTLAQCNDLLYLELNLDLKDQVPFVDESVLRKMCPKLAAAKFDFVVIENNKLLPFFLRNLPKKLKRLELDVSVQVTRVFEGEDTYQGPLRKTLEDIFNNELLLLQKDLSFSKPILIADDHEKKSAGEDAIEYFPSVFTLDSDTSRDNSPPVPSCFEANSCVRFDPRHARGEFYVIDPDTKELKLEDRGEENFSFVTGITPQEANSANLARVEKVFRDNPNQPWILMKLGEKEKEIFEPKGYNFLLSTGRYDTLVRDDKDQPLFASLCPGGLYFDETRGQYAFSLRSHNQESIKITAIFQHVPYTYSLSPMLSLRDNRDIKLLRFQNRAELDNTSVASSLSAYPEGRLVSALVRYFRDFQQKEFEYKENKHKENKTVPHHELSNQLKEQKAGLCRHRSSILAELFYGLKPMTNIHEDSVVILPANRAHIFAEFYTQGRWYRIELCPERKPQPEKRWFESSLDHTAVQYNVTQSWLKYVPEIKTEDPFAFFAAMSERLKEVQRKQVLVIFQEARHRFNFYHYLFRYYKNRFLIDDLSFVKKIETMVDEHHKQRTVPGPAHRFLHHAQDGDVLALNFIQLTDHIGYNTTVDSAGRLLDGTLIPRDVFIYAAATENQLLEWLEDVLSRFSRPDGLIVRVSSWPVPEEIKEQKEELFIHLNDRTKDWQNVLFGKKQYRNGQLHVKPGKLLKANPKQALCLINPPKNNDAFDAFIATHEFEFNGREYRWDGPIRTVSKDYYYHTEVMLNAPLNDKEWLLTQSSFRYLRPTMAYDYENKCTVDAPSILKQWPEGSTILAEDLSPDLWVRCLAYCEKFKKKFYFESLSEVPEPLKDKVKIRKILTAKIKKSNDHSELFRSLPFFSLFNCDDPSYVIACLAMQDQKPVGFALDDKLNTGLIERWYPENGSLAMCTGDLIKALESNQLVVLYQNLSKPLQDALLGLALEKPILMLNGVPYFPKRGKVVVISNQMKRVESTRVEVTLQNKLDLLQACLNLDSENFQVFKTTILKTNFIETPRFETLFALWQRNEIKSEPVSSLSDRLEGLARALSFGTSINVMGAACEEIISVILKLDGYRNTRVKLFLGLDSCKTWIEEQSEQKEMRILILSNSETLPGLHLPTMQHVVINSQRKDLKPYHKVIFIKEDFVKEDLLSPAMSVVFGRRLFQHVFSEDILPVLTPYVKKEMIEEVTKAFEQAFNALKNSSVNSAVYLQTMAMAFIDMIEKKSHQDIKAAAAQACNQVIKYVIPQQEEKFSLELKYALTRSNFCLTPTHSRTVRMMDDLIAIREFNMRHPDLPPMGLRGGLCSGPSGIGKSAVIKAYLEYRGFKPGNESSQEKNCYIILTPSRWDTLLALLLLAFHRGWFLIIDEVNTLKIEIFLIIFLAGLDLMLKRANSPGFIFIGTMNPIDFPGRVPLNDLNRLVLNVMLQDYTKSELSEVIKFNCPEIQDKELHALADVYHQSKKGNEVGFTIRDMKRIAELEVQKRRSSLAPQTLFGVHGSTKRPMEDEPRLNKAAKI